MMYILHFKCGPIDFYRESGSSGRLWIAYEVFNPGKAYAAVLCKSVGSNPTYLGYAFAMGTFLWKVSQILCWVNNKFWKMVMSWHGGRSRSAYRNLVDISSKMLNFFTTMLVKRNATLSHEMFVSSLDEVDQLCMFKVGPPPSGGPQKIPNSELRFFWPAL